MALDATIASHVTCHSTSGGKDQYKGNIREELNRMRQRDGEKIKELHNYYLMSPRKHTDKYILLI